MPKGSQKSKVHDVFQNRIDDLTKNAEEQAKAGLGDGVRPWQVPEDFGAEGLTDVPNLHEPSFNRDEINSQYEEILAEGGEGAGTLGDAMALTLQVAYVSAEERAFRLRHASPARLLAHGIGVREGHGDSEGIFGGAKKMVEDAVKTGGA